MTTRIWQGMFVAAVAILAMPAVRGGTVTYEMVTVGDPGHGDFPSITYSYQIGKYDVTVANYTAFLNAVAKTDTYGLYDSSMAYDGNVAGISRGGTSGNYSYSVIGDSGNKPITYVSWFDAARFANWMANGQPVGAQSSATTENGAYSVSGAVNGNAAARNAINSNTGLAPTFYLPLEPEWQKAAFFSPLLNNGLGGQWTYATQSNAVPGNNYGSASTPNQANYNNGVYSVTQSSTWSPSQNYLTDVGAFTGSASYYGTYDQTGNVWQWNDWNGDVDNRRGMRGGSWQQDSSPIRSNSFLYTPLTDFSAGDLGFRLAGPVQVSPVPEIDPAGLGSVLALVTGALGLLERRRAATA